MTSRWGGYPSHLGSAAFHIHGEMSMYKSKLLEAGDVRPCTIAAALLKQLSLEALRRVCDRPHLMLELTE
jgi:hypothetical protein